MRVMILLCRSISLYPYCYAYSPFPIEHTSGTTSCWLTVMQGVTPNLARFNKGRELVWAIVAHWPQNRLAWEEPYFKFNRKPISPKDQRNHWVCSYNTHWPVIFRIIFMANYRILCFSFSFELLSNLAQVIALAKLPLRNLASWHVA